MITETIVNMFFTLIVGIASLIPQIPDVMIGSIQAVIDLIAPIGSLFPLPLFGIIITNVFAIYAIEIGFQVVRYIRGWIPFMSS